MQGTILQNAILGGADLSNAIVDKETDCTGAKFVGDATKLPDQLRLMTLSGATFSDVLLPRDLTGIQWTKVEMSGLNLKDCILKASRMVDCDLSGSDLTGANCDNATFVDVNLTGAKLSKANCTFAKFERVRIGDVRFAGITLTEASLSNMELVDVALAKGNLQSAKLHKVDMSGANLESANLQGAELFDVTLRNANLAKAVLDNAKVRKLRAVDGAKFEDARMFGLQVDAASWKELEKLVPEKTGESWIKLPD